MPDIQRRLNEHCRLEADAGVSDPGSRTAGGQLQAGGQDREAGGDWQERREEKGGRNEKGGRKEKEVRIMICNPAYRLCFNKLTIIIWTPYINCGTRPCDLSVKG